MLKIKDNLMLEVIIFGIIVGTGLGFLTLFIFSFFSFIFNEFTFLMNFLLIFLMIDYIQNHKDQLKSLSLLSLIFEKELMKQFYIILTVIGSILMIHNFSNEFNITMCASIFIHFVFYMYFWLFILEDNMSEIKSIISNYID